MKGESNVDNIDILGNTTESAIQATKQALYNLDHSHWKGKWGTVKLQL